MARLELEDAENRCIQANNNYKSAYSQLGAAITDCENKQDVFKEAKANLVLSSGVDLAYAQEKVQQRVNELDYVSDILNEHMNHLQAALDKQSRAESKVVNKESQLDIDKAASELAEFNQAQAKSTLRNAQAEEAKAVIDFGVALEKNRRARETAIRTATQATQARQQSVYGGAAAQARAAAGDDSGMIFAEASDVAANKAQIQAGVTKTAEAEASSAQHKAEEDKRNAIQAVDAATQYYNDCSKEVIKAIQKVKDSEADLQTARDEKLVADDEVMAMQAAKHRAEQTATRQEQLKETAVKLERLQVDAHERNLHEMELAESNLGKSILRLREAREEFIRRMGERAQSRYQEELTRLGGFARTSSAVIANAANAASMAMLNVPQDSIVEYSQTAEQRALDLLPQQIDPSVF